MANERKHPHVDRPKEQPTGVDRSEEGGERTFGRGTYGSGGQGGERMGERHERSRKQSRKRD